MTAARTAVRLRTTTVAAVLMAVAAGADGPPAPVREAFIVETDGAAEKKLAAVADYAGQGRWDAAVGLLRDVAAGAPSAFVRVSGDRSLSIPAYAEVVLSRLPAEGLAAYRAGADPLAAAWLAEADATGDDRPLRAIATRAFLSFYGDEAVRRLAERAWERGDVDAARLSWTQLVPLGPAAAGRPLPAVLRYPDTDLDLAAIRARLVLCSIAAGELRRAAREVQAFRELHPDAAGRLAGRDGNLAEILATALSEAGTGGGLWDVLPPAAATATYAATAARRGAVREGAGVSAPAWFRPLSPSPFLAPSGRPALAEHGPPAFHPVVWRGKTFVADAGRVAAFDLDTGQPAWPARAEDDGVLYASAAADLPPPGVPLIGTARHTLTVAGDRLFARLGPPVTAWPANDLRTPETELVCLDLAREGALAWRVEDGSLGAEGDRWAFEGPPAADGDRLYALASRSRPQSQLNALCLDAATGAVVWNRVVGAPIVASPERAAVMTHRLPAVAAGRVYVATGHGAVVCLDAGDGRPVWLGWYESEPAAGPEANDPARAVPDTCLVAGGVVVAAPSDSDRVFAFDAASGVRLWDRPLRGGGRELIGAADGVLAVSGERLWGLDLLTGRELWSVGFEDPPGYGAGRGLIAGRTVWWPTREELLAADLDTGRVRRRLPLAAAYGLAGGGNLATGGGRLLLARPDGLVAFRTP